MVVYVIHDMNHSLPCLHAYMHAYIRVMTLFGMIVSITDGCNGFVCSQLSLKQQAGKGKKEPF